jgi:uncharacterized protein
VNLPAWAQSAGLLVISNVFMTFAWYAHLKNMAAKPWVIAALASWGIVPFAFFYMKQPLKLDFLWAGLCLVAAAYFMFRGD